MYLIFHRFSTLEPSSNQGWRGNERERKSHGFAFSIEDEDGNFFTLIEAKILLLNREE